ncbi:hypothetical protein QQG91_12760 [Marivivens sp. LCG002]|uniref:hypothetical protein n=1 Tax=Marivivens sp. LCG002 TaxID=3051171 RepID=UPI0025530189|nr:hypothetical protein [Marivivens sp. LCG002]WIV50529.1 hypothetical protein QQG91_12760 [Marivivens sp. LCG002]
MRDSFHQVLGQLEDEADLANLAMSPSPIFDKLAKLACHLASRSDARVFLNLRDKQVAIGSHGDPDWIARNAPIAQDGRQYPAFVDIPDGENYFGSQVEPVVVDGEVFAPSCLCLVGLGAEGARYGSIVVFDFEKKGAIPYEVQQELLLLGRLVSHLIEVSSSLNILKMDLDRLLH